MPPYKKQVLAGDVPEIKAGDLAPGFRALSEGAGQVAKAASDIGERSARLAFQTFQNNFEIESRTMLDESYERNRNNPLQLKKEQEKIRVNLLKALPNEQMRNEASVKFALHAMAYMERAKDNLYKQNYEEAQTSTLQYVDNTMQGIAHGAASLYAPNPERSKAAIISTMADIGGVIERIATPDNDGNYHLTPLQRVAVQRKLNIAITAGARSYFDSLDDRGKVSFAKEYAQKKIQINTLDPVNPEQIIKTDIGEILDEETYKENMSYFQRKSDEAERDILLNESTNILNNPEQNLYKAVDFINASKGVSMEAKKEATDILYAQISHNKILKENLKEQDRERALNNANAFMLEGKVKDAISTIKNSALSNTDKVAIIEKLKKSQTEFKPTDNPEVYNDLVTKINSGEVYQNSQILSAFAKGEITDTTKNSLIKTLEQQQEPSFEIFKRANTQIQKVFDKGLMGTLTPAESAAMTYTLREISDIYNEALKQNKSTKEIEDILSPEKINEIGLKWQPTRKETSESYMKKLVKPNNNFIPQAQPGQSIEDYIKEHRK